MTSTVHLPSPHAAEPEPGTTPSRESDPHRDPHRPGGRGSSTRSALTPRALLAALPGALRKLDPRVLVRNPVMMIVEVGAAFCTVVAALGPALGDPTSPLFAWSVALWLWATVLFGTLAESIAEGRGKAQAASLRATRATTSATRVLAYDGEHDPGAQRAPTETIPSASLRMGDVVVVTAGQLVPGDGDVVHGIATVDESAITGESAPVVRESGGDASAVTGGTRVLSDRIVVRITAAPGRSFVDRMIALVEGANRARTPNEVALTILLASLSVIFVVTVLTLNPIASLVAEPVGLVVLVALLVCLIPTTIGALLSAIGIAGMDRLVRHNVLAMSGRAVEAAGDVSTLLLDKTGTITYGNRRATAFRPVPGVALEELVRAAGVASVGDPTPEGASIVDLAVTLGWERPATIDGEVVPFTAQTRMSGFDGAAGDGATHDGARTVVRKGAGSAVLAWLAGDGGTVPPDVAVALEAMVDEIASSGGTPLVVAERAAGASTGRVLGVVHLKDVVKDGLRERFDQLRAMGIRTVMVTGDNRVTAAAIAREAGVDDVLAEATPEDKLALIRREQEGGRLVAMTGDGTNDAPALAQADVGVAMNTGTSAAKEAGNMVDLDSDPTKLLDIVRIGKQLLITRGALTTFSLANDLAKYFAIVPAMFMGSFPGLAALNVMHLSSPTSAVLSAVVFNALVIVALVPLAIRGVAYRPMSASRLLARNLLVFGLGGVVAPFVGIKLIDLLVSTLPGM